MDIVVVALVTELVRKEIDVLFRARDENIERLNEQVKTLLKDVERITMELESRNTWNRSMTKHEPAKLQWETPPIKKKPARTSFKRLPSLDYADDDANNNARNEEGKLIFAKNLPRVATIDKSSASQTSLALQKQKIYDEAFVRYPECRSSVFAPSSWDPRNVSMQQFDLPSLQLQLSWVHGYHSTANSNVFYLASHELVWFTATIVVIYSKSKQTQRFYVGHSKEITSMAVHPNMQVVASGQCGKDSATILVWDSNRAKTDADHVLAKLEGQTVHVRSLSFSHDGKLVASLGGDLYNTICVHDWQEQTLLVKARGHSAKVWTVVFNPYQAYGMPDKVKHQRQGKRNKQEARPTPGQALRDEDACYTLVTCGVQHIKFWTLTQVEYTPPSTVAKEESAFYGSCFGGPNRMRQPTPHDKVWKLEGNPPLMKSEAQDFTCVTFSNDNIPLRIYDDGTDSVADSMTDYETTLGRIIAGTAKGDLYVFWQPRKPIASSVTAPQKWWELPVTSWQVDGGICIEHIQYESTAKLVEIIPHDVATGNRFKISRHAQMELADLQQRLALKPDAKPLLERIASLEYRGQLAHSTTCTQLACDGKTVASVGADGKLHLWSLHLLDPMRVVGTQTLGVYAALGTSPSDGRHKLQLERSVPLPTKARVTSLHWNRDLLVAGMSNHSIWEWDAASGDWSVVTEGCEAAILGLSPAFDLVVNSSLGGVVMENENELVTVSTDHSLSCWNMAAHTVERKVSLRTTGTCVEAHPNRRQLAVGCASGELVLLRYPDLSEKKSVRVLTCESISVLKYSPDGKYLAVGAKDNCMHVYDTGTYRRVTKCEGHATFVAHIDWSIDGYLVQTNSADGEILYWQVTPTAVRQITDSMLMRDILWSRWSCIFGWPVQGIWAENSACSDVAAVCLLETANVVLVAYRSSLRSFRWPCLKSAQCYSYEGHAACITGVHKLNKQVVTLGGSDCTIMEWTSMIDDIPSRIEVDMSEQELEAPAVSASPTPPPPISADTNRTRTPRQVFLKDDARDEYTGDVNELLTHVPSETEAPSPAKEGIFRPSSPTNDIECGRAKFDFTGENSDELSFKDGEVIRVVEKRPGDWWLGESCDGTRGIFPKDYIEMAM
ncbi:hypothetical protein AeMF1_007851 [Aphanomyces euteiches]|nr:hypothetical protein AeMF1_007851 [Aphanomyces euteiches]KAH9197296.1 hypothetical protein AeNC1_000733 [Aphanomyces euteiches]